MSTIAFDQFALTRIADFARSLSRLHQASRRQLVDDDQIDREFNAVCLSVWGYTGQRGQPLLQPHRRRAGARLGQLEK